MVFTPTVSTVAHIPSKCDKKGSCGAAHHWQHLVASRRLVMHTCESHDEGMICFIMAFDPSCRLLTNATFDSLQIRQRTIDHKCVVFEGRAVASKVSPGSFCCGVEC